MPGFFFHQFLAAFQSWDSVHWSLMPEGNCVQTFETVVKRTNDHPGQQLAEHTYKLKVVHKSKNFVL